MTAPNMATITESLERSLQNCSLNNNHRRRHNHHQHNRITATQQQQQQQTSDRSSTSDENQTTLELNSHLTLPYHWEQCLDLKTGEIYYINWRSGLKAKEDPRTVAESSGEYYYSDDDEDDSSYDSEESSSESTSGFRDRYDKNRNNNNSSGGCGGDSSSSSNNNVDNVLVVAGCKSCLMYFMVPKQVEDCPKCNGQLLHFDRSDNNASSP